MLRLMPLVVGLVALALAACGDANSFPTATREPIVPAFQTEEMPTPTPTPKLPGSITPAPASERYRLDLGDGVVVAFVEGLSPKLPGKVAYVTHVPTGSQLVLNPGGEVIDRHNGRDDGPGRLDAVLADQATLDRILEGLQGDEDLRPRASAADWAHSIQFSGITYLAKGSLVGPIITQRERALAIEDLGPELYRVAFRIDGYGGNSQQDGNATYLSPGTPVYAVKGYAPEFRLAALEDGRARLFEADTNPAAKTGKDLLDIRDKVTSIDVLSTKNSIKVIGAKEEDEEDAVLGTIEKERAVERFVELVLESPVDQGRRDREGPRYFLEFRLADGTSAVRLFWLDSGELSRGIMTGPMVAMLVRRATNSGEWGGGTGIRLGTRTDPPTNTDSGQSDAERRIQLPQAVEQALAAQPSPDWQLVEAPGLGDQPGFSLRLPDGWELNETQPLDSYVGELVGDGVRLRFDYGRFSAILNPEARPETTYVLRYEDIGGYEAKLVIPLDPSGGLTGVHFRAMDGLRLTIVGKDLTPEQQRTAFAIFRSIRSANRAADEPSASKSNPRLVIRRGPMSVTHQGIDYEAVAGPIREDLLDVDRLEPTELALNDSGLRDSKGGRVYLLPGVPLEQGFLVRSTEKGMYRDIWYLDPETAYPVCQPGARNHFYVAEGTSPTPPSVPATDTPTIKTDLSSEGLLEAGWPLVNMASLKFEFRGVEYSYVDHSHFGGYVQIEELETLVIDYNVDVGRLPSPALEEIATGATVQDRIRIYRLPNRPVNEVILVDQCPGDLHGHQFVYYQQTGLHRKHTSEAPKLATTPTPEPMQPGTKRTMPPEYVRLDLDPKVVVAFVDDDDLGRIVYVTHVPSGAQVVLDAESNVLEKHFGSTAGDRALNMALRDADVMERIRRGLQYDGDIPGNAIMDWVNFIHFGGHEYLSNAMRGEGDEVDESRLGEVLYRVAFHVDANLVPGDYRPRDGDAAFLPPGTAIRSVDGYSPSEVLAAVVEGEVWLFKRSVPGPSTPTPVVVPRSP